MEAQFFPGCFLLLLALCGWSFRRRNYLTRQKYFLLLERVLLLCLLSSFHLKWQKRRKKKKILMLPPSEYWSATAAMSSVKQRIFSVTFWFSSSLFEITLNSFSQYTQFRRSLPCKFRRQGCAKKRRKQIYTTTHVSNGQNQNSRKVFYFSARPTLWHLKTSSVSAFSHLSDLLQTCCTWINLVQ